jgi:hypothetical protein
MKRHTASRRQYLKPDKPEPWKLLLPFVNLPVFAQLLATARKQGDEFRSQISAKLGN